MIDKRWPVAVKALAFLKLKRRASRKQMIEELAVSPENFGEVLHTLQAAGLIEAKLAENHERAPGTPGPIPLMYELKKD